MLGLSPSELTPGLTYDLRRLRLHGLIERLPRTYRYRLTAKGLQTALFYTRVYARILRPGLALINTPTPPQEALRRTFQAAEQAVNSWCDHVNLAA